MSEAEYFQKLREQMVTWQIQRRGLTDERLLEAFRRIPRHCFVPTEHRDSAYEDFPLPIGYGQTISQPYIVALMTSLLELDGSQRVLEIGSGSGYQAAILACLAAEVHSLELHPELAERAARRLAELGLHNAHIHCADGSAGWPEAAPYDGMLVTAAAPQPPPALLEQLAPGGRLVIPVGGRGEQSLQRWQRGISGWDVEEVLPVVFVPLRGAAGWDEEHWPTHHL